jgi:hypothetical protein
MALFLEMIKLDWQQFGRNFERLQVTAKSFK